MLLTSSSDMAVTLEEVTFLFWKTFLSLLRKKVSGNIIQTRFGPDIFKVETQEVSTGLNTDNQPVCLVDLCVVDRLGNFAQCPPQSCQSGTQGNIRMDLSHLAVFMQFSEGFCLAREKRVDLFKSWCTEVNFLNQLGCHYSINIQEDIDALVPYCLSNHMAAFTT